MKKITKIVAPILLALIVFSCNSKSAYFDAILKSGEGHFRGINISSTIKEVKAIEDTSALKDDLSDYLYYEYDLDMGNSYTLAYKFYNQQLYTVEVAGYFDVKEDATTVFNDFKAHFDKKYGKGKTRDTSYTAWNTSSTKTNNKLEIILLNETKKEDAYGFVSILISDLDY